ncbi:MAG: hypothetical protein WAV23_00725 [Minisyncoccia bacterium]
MTTESSDKKPSYSPDWVERVGGFAIAVGKTTEEITDALILIIGDPGEDALQILADTMAVPDNDLKTAFAALKIPSGKINMHLSKLRGAPKAAETVGANSNGPAMQALAILPVAPDDVSFLEMLKTGGVLKVETTEVISAVKAALANRIGLYRLPEKILIKMEEFANKQEEPCTEVFYKMQKLLTEKKYGDVLAAIGVPGSYVSEGRKKDFFTKLDAKFWVALDSFNKELVTWQQTWMNGAANPGLMMMAMTASHVGGTLPPGMMSPPDTTPLRSSAEEVVNEINRIFAGPGIPIARALAYDATRIMGILKDPTLPAQVGSSNKEQMLKELGVNVGADLVRTEQGVTRFTLAIMSLPKVAADAELAYFSALIQLGATIPWDKLTNTTGAGIGKKMAQQL